MATVKQTPPPPAIKPEATVLIAEAEAAGFTHLGWLLVTMSSFIPLAAFANEDGSVTLVIIGSMINATFSPSVVECVSHLEGPTKVTTTTNRLAIGQPARGIFKHSHPELDLTGLVARHLQHVDDAGQPIDLVHRTLAEV
ncbi:MAG: hypothetical protein ACR2QM_03220, partial [Longimicrobiales bacterium]